ncbi:MAG: VWA domain-containing protein [Candidatus Sulfopaludibacter sp.]|nr:VWA domain-containing protein [Candidatus Sulfopaludibacter sp.]
MTVIRAHTAPVLIGAVALIGVLAARAADETGDGPRSSGSDIRVDSLLVLIPVSVTDLRNRPVTGLASHQFRVFEGKAEQKVVGLSREDAPLSVGIVFDASGSMAGKLAKAREAVQELLKRANPEDEFFLVTFSGTAKVAVPFTGNAGDIAARLMFADSGGKTALLDAIYLGLHYMKNAGNARRALLVISDGGENDSRYSERELRAMLREGGVAVYAIGIYARGVPALPEEERSGPKLLTDLAEQSGGRHFAVNSANELPGAAAKIGLELRNQYVLAYRPEGGAEDGKYRRVQVKLVAPRDLRLSWRPGYYARRR